MKLACFNRYSMGVLGGSGSGNETWFLGTAVAGMAIGFYFSSWIKP